MSKQAYIARYGFILRKLKQHPYSSFEEVQAYVTKQLEFLDAAEGGFFSLRTFQRDVREIRALYGVEIVYSRKEKGYYIAGEAGGSAGFHRMMQAFDLFQALNVAEDLSPYIHFDHGSPQGTEFLQPLLQAIRSRNAVRFRYLKFHEVDHSDRFVDPLAIKEYRNRWYLLARERERGELKTFGLDRMSQLVQAAAVFDYPREYSVAEHFRHSFGIVNPSDTEPEEVILSFTPFQGKYIRTLPLHSSQEIVSDTPDELRVRLHLRITEDFIMELLAQGDQLTVISPTSLRYRMQYSFSRALRNYD